ncbi:SOS response-associated peptidase [Aeromicrobium sp. CF4.19]|uniref:SOS response-associated peptidase n=1 Tax=Aeromicrobium sp. CF4.19 TaxID=3373082 RepID=UPI003EE54B57
MCGRYATTRTPAELDDAFGLRLPDSTARLEADYNVAPTKLAPLVVGRTEDGAPGVQRELLAATWGLVPSWAKDPAIGSKMINARSETVAEKPAFRRAFASRRALVPADGYYEWYAGPQDAPKQPKQPFFITAPDRSVLALAGLYEFWRASPEQEWLITFTILTTSAEDAQGRLHDRAPMLVHADAVDAWLEPVRRPGEELREMLTPATPGPLTAYPVDRAVGNVRNNGPELIEPLPLQQ